ncbi:MAG: metal ABC transporter permease [Bacillota bacterium]|uniref:Manganese transport system membrane protein MntC n=1 Tax=Virgibacillus salarius TaxID=447199 RepID=A0A941I8Y0_9BACI|nr:MULTISPECIES: iron chelate uptake ABC transporter family permease subunit [Virgibacillus]NAZ07663.1 iron chelate uptake ABC transporter family permease subunit [Agaribacter marinus]MBR7794943.1 metal ABC transporter permease [Virgibacillus salarius]MCC2252676.1 metal ABC transporter permease [Virgibacillus sp. AGTR]QRZ18770.1 metal ABC transporter permease [Virgibacillus sp. AGTR]WBX81651.1 metal ABC transporter permease [Virgibacillus salarius]
MEAVTSFFSSANLQWVLIGSLLLGFASGVIGSFVLLKKQSLISDAMAHAALPGVCIVYILFQVKSVPFLLAGAAVTSLIATQSIQTIVNRSRIKTDAAIGIIISVFFGLGIVLLTYIQQNSSGNQAGLDSFIFGQAASLVRSDVQLIAIGAFVLIILTALFFKEFKISIFDPQFARGIGLPVTFFNGVLLFLVVAVVVIGIQMVGVVLIAALLITPPISARYWTDRLGLMTILAGIFGAISGVSGAVLSTALHNLPTGPVIVLSASLIFFISLLFGSRKGLLFKGVRHA